MLTPKAFARFIFTKKWHVYRLSLAYENMRSCFPAVKPSFPSAFFRATSNSTNGVFSYLQYTNMREAKGPIHEIHPETVSPALLMGLRINHVFLLHTAAVRETHSRTPGPNAAPLH